MDLNEKTYDKIQNYLDGKLKGEELKTFESDMKSNQALSNEVDLNHKMKEFLEDSSENELRRNLQILNNRITEDSSKSKSSWVYWSWLMPLMLIGGWWLMSNIGSENTPSIQNEQSVVHVPDQQSSPNEEETIPAKDETNKIEQETNTLPERTEETKTPASPKKQNQKPASQKSGPIAAANFEPNPSLDFLIQNNLRDNEIEIQVQKTQDNVNNQASISFQFSAILKSKTDLSAKNFKLHLFSNDKKSFEDFIPISTDDLQLVKADENNYQIDFQKDIALPKGLYYYLVEDIVTEKIYFVEKFEVR